MISLDDPKWQTFKGGYHSDYDASVQLRAFEADPNVAAQMWEEFWNKLHHQGGVHIASYAAVPHLVRIYIKHGLLDWKLFGFVATVEDCRLFGDNPHFMNPQLPHWLESDYYAAIKSLAAFGAQHFTEDWSKELAQSFLAVAAFAKNIPKTGRMLITFLGEDEIDEVFEKFFQ